MLRQGHTSPPSPARNPELGGEEAEGQMPAPMHGVSGGAAEEKQSHAVTSTVGQLSTSGHDGDLGEDNEQEEVRRPEAWPRPVTEMAEAKKQRTSQVRRQVSAYVAAMCSTSNMLCRSCWQCCLPAAKVCRKGQLRLQQEGSS